MDGVITKQSEEYIMIMGMLRKCSKEILEFQNLQVPVANEVYMIGEQVCNMLHISSRTLQKLRDEKGIAYTVIGGKFLYPLSKLQSVLEKIIEVMFVKSSDEFVFILLFSYICKSK